MYNNNLENLKRALNEYIQQKNYDNIVAVYVMGSSVRKEKFNDYDINVFVKNDNFDEVENLEKMKIFLEDKLQKKIDYNVIGMECVNNNILNSDIFMHKNRHSLLLYEIIVLKNLVYGEDILKKYRVNYSDLIFETLKLAMTQVHRLNKEYLAKNKENAYKNARKYLKYTIEFAMIFSGMENPYMNLNKKIVLQKFPTLKKYEIEIENAINNVDVDLKNAYNCMVDLSKEMLERFKYLIMYIEKNDKLMLDKKLSEIYFEFKNTNELKMFKDLYCSQPQYKRVVVKEVSNE